jgi:hypothetical protein
LFETLYDLCYGKNDYFSQVLKIKFYILPLSLFLISCKKDRICECSTTWTFQYSNGSGYDTRIFPSDSKEYSKGLTKKQAINSCNHQRETIQSSFEDLITYHGNDPLKSGEKIETKCILH